MGNNAFDGKILTEKLRKLNNSQQSIESVSRLCVSHRKRAKDIVETWNKLFSSSQKDQRVPFLNLANDILQTSKRKGNEFVNEFWKVLPSALKRVYASDESGKNSVIRLIDIWEERKVFGSRSQGLKGEIMSKSSLPSSVSNGKNSNSNSNPIKIAKRDAQSLRLKLAIGSLPEKIITALHSVNDEHPNEEAALNKCKDAVCQVGKLLEDVENTLSQGNQLESTLVHDLQQQEKELKQYMVQLENAEAARATLLSQLKEALQEQESSQELVHSQLQAAQDQIERVASIRKRFVVQAPETPWVPEQNIPPVQPNSIPLQPSLTQPTMSFAPLQTIEEDTKAAAAAVAARLAASTSSALMLTSVLSSLVAEEAASMNGSLNSAGYPSPPPGFYPEKRPKLEHQTPVSDVNSSDTRNSSFFATFQQPSSANVSSTPPTMQSISQPNQLQSAFASTLPPPPHSHMNPPTNQYVQSTGVMVGGMPYGYGSNNLQPPPPPPLPPHVAMGLTRPNNQPSQSPQSQAQQVQQQQQQQSSTGGFYRSPGVGFYGQSHAPPPPPPASRQ